MRDLTSIRFPVLLSAYPSADGAFLDTRVVLHLVGDRSDPYHGPDRWHDDGVGEHQSVDGPRHLVIGRYADPAALQRAAHRTGVNVEDLQRFQAEACHV